jgi:hypothetical protein
MEVLGYFNENDGKLRITSNSLNSLPEGETAFVVRFTKLTNDQIHASDFGTAAGYLNGDKVNVNLIAPKVTPKNDNVYFNVYPNPTNDYIFIGIDMDVKAEIVDMNGRILVSNISVSANSAERVDVSSLPTGIYMIRVFGDDYTSTQRVIISK